MSKRKYKVEQSSDAPPAELIKRNEKYDAYIYAVSSQIMPIDEDCKHETSEFISKQTRQADEIATCCVHCLKCGKIIRK